MSLRRKIFLKRVGGGNSKRRNTARQPIKVTKLSFSNGTQVRLLVEKIWQLFDLATTQSSLKERATVF